MLKQFTIAFSRTVNLGNFESARVEASVTHEVPDGANLETVREGAQAQLRDLLEQTWRAQKTKAKEGERNEQAGRGEGAGRR